MAVISVETPNGVVQVEIAGNTPTAAEASGIKSAFFSGGGDVKVEPYKDMGFVQQEIEDYKNIGRQIGSAASSYATGVKQEVSDIAALPSVSEKVAAGGDVVNRGLIAGTLGAPVDIADLIVGGLYSGVDYITGDRLPDYQFGNAFGGSQSIIRGMENTGIASETSRPNLELTAAIAPAIISGGATVAPKVISGAVKTAQATARGVNAVANSPITRTAAGIAGDVVDAGAMASGMPPPVRLARVAKGVVDIASGKTQGSEAIGAELGRRLGGSSPITGRIGEGIGRQLGRMAAKQTDEVVVPTAAVKPTPVANIDEALTRSRGALGETASMDTINAAAVETRAQGIIANAKAQGVSIPKKSAQQQARGEMDTIVAAQEAEKAVAVRAQQQAAAAERQAVAAAEEKAFIAANKDHINAVDKAIAENPALAEQANQRAGINYANVRDRWIREPDVFKKQLDDLAAKSAPVAPRPVAPSVDGNPSTADILATIRARANKPAAESPVDIPAAMPAPAPANPDILAQIRARANPAAAEAPVVPTMNPEAQAKLAQIRARANPAETTVDMPTAVAGRSESRSLADIRAKLRKAEEELPIKERMDLEKLNAQRDNRSAAMTAVQDVKSDIRGYVIQQRSGRKNIVNKDILKTYAKDRNLDIDFSTLPDTSGMPFGKARTAVINWMYKAVKDAKQGYKAPESTYGVLFGE